MIEREMNESRLVLIRGSGEQHSQAWQELADSGMRFAVMGRFGDYDEVYPEYEDNPVIKDFKQGEIVAIGLKEIREFIKNSSGTRNIEY